MTTFTFNGCSLTVATPPESAPAGAALLTINGWTFGLGQRSVHKLADVMLRRNSARFGLDPDCNLILDVDCSGSPSGVTLLVEEHGTPTDVRITIPSDEIAAVADALANLQTA